MLLRGLGPDGAGAYGQPWPGLDALGEAAHPRLPMTLLAPQRAPL